MSEEIIIALRSALALHRKTRENIINWPRGLSFHKIGQRILEEQREDQRTTMAPLDRSLGRPRPTKVDDEDETTGSSSSSFAARRRKCER
jgi:hypothetical protein